MNPIKDNLVETKNIKPLTGNLTVERCKTCGGILSLKVEGSVTNSVDSLHPFLKCSCYEKSEESTES